MKKKRRKKKRILPIVLLSVAAIVAVVVVLCITGVIRVSESQNSTAQKGYRVAYVVVNQENIVVDTNGKVTEITTEAVVDLPVINGLKFGIPVVGESLTCENENCFKYALSIAKELNNNGILVQDITIGENGKAETHFKKVTVKLGTESKTAEKIRDLKDIYSQIKDLCGILNMEHVNETMGYTFKVTEEEATTAQVMEETVTEGNVEETEENTEEYWEDSEEYTEENTKEYTDEYIDEYTEENTEEYWEESGENPDEGQWEDEENGNTEENQGEY